MNWKMQFVLDCVKLYWTTFRSKFEPFIQGLWCKKLLLRPLLVKKTLVGAPGLKKGKNRGLTWFRGWVANVALVASGLSWWIDGVRSGRMPLRLTDLLPLSPRAAGIPTKTHIRLAFAPFRLRECVAENNMCMSMIVFWLRDVTSPAIKVICRRHNNTKHSALLLLFVCGSPQASF